MSMDVLTLGAGIFSFAVFLFIHVISFRWLAPEQLLRSLLLTVAAIMALPVMLMGSMVFLRIIGPSWQELVCASFLAMLINGLCCCGYVLCVFGPYETSVRMRLVREIAAGADKGVSIQELLGRYSAETIVDVRLRRLLGSGDIIEKDGVYHPGRVGNLFFVFDTVARVIKKWIGR